MFAEWLALSISEAPPEPFDRAEVVIGQPARAPVELERPDYQDDHDKPATRNLTEQTKAEGIKEKSADEGLSKVVGKGHSTDTGETVCE